MAIWFQYYHFFPPKLFSLDLNRDRGIVRELFCNQDYTKLVDLLIVDYNIRIRDKIT